MAEESKTPVYGEASSPLDDSQRETLHDFLTDGGINLFYAQRPHCFPLPACLQACTHATSSCSGMCSSLLAQLSIAFPQFLACIIQHTTPTPPRSGAEAELAPTSDAKETEERKEPTVAETVKNSIEGEQFLRRDEFTIFYLIRKCLEDYAHGNVHFLQSKTVRISNGKQERTQVQDCDDPNYTLSSRTQWQAFARAVTNSQDGTDRSRVVLDSLALNNLTMRFREMSLALLRCFPSDSEPERPTWCSWDELQDALRGIVLFDNTNALDWLGDLHHGFAKARNFTWLQYLNFFIQKRTVAFLFKRQQHPLQLRPMIEALQEFPWPMVDPSSRPDVEKMMGQQLWKFALEDVARHEEDAVDTLHMRTLQLLLDDMVLPPTKRSSLWPSECLPENYQQYAAAPRDAHPTRRAPPISDLKRYFENGSRVFLASSGEIFQAVRKILPPFLLVNITEDFLMWIYLLYRGNPILQEISFLPTLSTHTGKRFTWKMLDDQFARTYCTSMAQYTSPLETQQGVSRVLQNLRNNIFDCSPPHDQPALYEALPILVHTETLDLTAWPYSPRLRRCIIDLYTRNPILQAMRGLATLTRNGRLLSCDDFLHELANMLDNSVQDQLFPNVSFYFAVSTLKKVSLADVDLAIGQGSQPWTSDSTRFILQQLVPLHSGGALSEHHSDFYIGLAAALQSAFVLLDESGFKVPSIEQMTGSAFFPVRFGVPLLFNMLPDTYQTRYFSFAGPDDIRQYLKFKLDTLVEKLFQASPPREESPRAQGSTSHLPPFT